MSEVDEFDRNEATAAEGYRGDLRRAGSGLHEVPPAPQPVRESPARAVGSPLPVGSPGRTTPPAGHGEGLPSRPAAPPGRALSTQPHADTDLSHGIQWALGALKQAVPFMQRLLPLIDGNIGTAFSSLTANHPHAPSPAPRVDLAPLETGLSELQLQHRDLRTQVVEQNSSLKRVEDQLDMVREATDRNTLEQQELIEDLKTMANKVNLVAVLLLGLLVVSVLLNLFLFLHIQRVLP